MTGVWFVIRTVRVPAGYLYITGTRTKDEGRRITILGLPLPELRRDRGPAAPRATITPSAAKRYAQVEERLYAQGVKVRSGAARFVHA